MLVGTANGKLTGSGQPFSAKREREREKLKKIETKIRGPPM